MNNDDYKSKWDTLKERLVLAALGFEISAKSDCTTTGIAASHSAGVIKCIIQYMDEVDSEGGDKCSG